MAVPVRDVAAVLVTRGNVDLSPILDSLPFPEVVVWDNSRRPHDMGVYGRYAAIRETTRPWVYVQDDDCVVAPGGLDLLLADTQWGHLTANMPADYRPNYPHSCLVGFGALFQRHLPFLAFTSYWTRLERTEAEKERFLRTCDVPFAVLTPRILVDAGVRHLRQAFDDDRMCRQPGHEEERSEAFHRARGLLRLTPA